ncbi:MAG: phytanoyl-CoA dioxygenase family protein [Erythrobacter sp.]|uniref:phytanoyl-CoA dioxygenase family protein n=1 Tax=Erythrobacter sp. TaxID=1042 RepID=UPI0025DE7763|nr:phytanoyl-CoA dioxygenase family protein [Erythrobacter sp.]MCL9998029.1 phytanoyl-CoA dioxygenase family protein [Erythrobacter sp.]
MAGKLAGGAGGLSDLRLATDGAQLFAGAARDMLPVLADWYRDVPATPGTRLDRLGAFTPFLAAPGPIAELASKLLGRPARPVRAIAFDKSPDANWALGWHQDRTINVAARAEVAGFGPWTVKQGHLHVQPPFTLIERMVTLRIHLDPVTPDNAPLEIAIGSHRKGLIAEPRIAEVVATCESRACLAAPGDVWAYATAILHASRRSASAGPRRVLQVDYSADTLPAPLDWALTFGDPAFS